MPPVPHLLGLTWLACAPAPRPDTPWDEIIVVELDREDDVDPGEIDGIRETLSWFAGEAAAPAVPLDEIRLRGALDGLRFEAIGLERAFDLRYEPRARTLLAEPFAFVVRHGLCHALDAATGASGQNRDWLVRAALPPWLQDQAPDGDEAAEVFAAACAEDLVLFEYAAFDETCGTTRESPIVRDAQRLAFPRQLPPTLAPAALRPAPVFDYREAFPDSGIFGLPVVIEGDAVLHLQTADGAERVVRVTPDGEPQVLARTPDAAGVDRRALVPSDAAVVLLGQEGATSYALWDGALVPFIVPPWASAAVSGDQVVMVPSTYDGGPLSTVVLPSGLAGTLAPPDGAGAAVKLTSRGGALWLEGWNRAWRRDGDAWTSVVPALPSLARRASFGRFVIPLTDGREVITWINELGDPEAGGLAIRSAEGIALDEGACFGDLVGTYAFSDGEVVWTWQYGSFGLLSPP